MSYLTKDQLGLSTKSKPTLGSESKNLTSINVPPNSPLSPTTPSSSLPEERKISVVRGPRSPPPSKSISLINSQINSNNENSVESSQTIKTTNIIPELTQEPSTQTSSITPSVASSHTNEIEKKTQYKNLDDIVNDLSYPLETKLSLKPDNNSSVNPVEDVNTKKTIPTTNISNNKDTPSNGGYVFSAALKSNSKSDSSTLSNESPITTNKPSVTASENNVPITQERRNSRPLLTSSLDCAGCGKTIAGKVLTAMGKKWHPEHFSCKHCGITLEYVAFFEKDGYPYCHLDYHELFSPKCGHCGNTIEGPFITALGKSWHQGHFFCRECGNPFESGGFMVNDGFPYCEKDWIKKFAPKCKGCQEPIRGEFMSALDGMWHRECFVCKACKTPFNSSYYYIHEGNPYCDTHYRERLSN
ncbi:15415_t:CDS:2 [Dentiscutata erythropus]|uniref:15415_t:CDS:1 n=1 Tax=Dentiscutata erythropus TaxID=1348616 RepID=A0A9N9GNE3_9GLOM|nr:15415_t:CDS:2 [Dentiscutata erythropus]